MARTYRNRHTVPKGTVVRDGDVLYSPHGPDARCTDFRANLYRKEKKEYRKVHYRRYRASVKDLMRHERWDDILPYRRTSGWLTW